ncbi:MAG TPA: glycosyltransferase family 39 protein [Acidimicrobiales bacterium]|nr:glycosyltransferase family 39 protein [Acidimicrobiales bacterium]
MSVTSTGMPPRGDVLEIEISTFAEESHVWGSILAVAAVAAIALGVALRVWSASAMWLDEAQTVAIARLPVGAMLGALRTDGAPPLYYLLLHLWMAAFGTGTNVIRLLSSAMSIATLPLAWRLGRIVSGRRGAVTSLLLFASSPFAIRYATETRMYSLVVLLVCVVLVLVFDSEHPVTRRRLVLLGVTTTALVFTHYWALLFVAAIGAFLLVRTLLGREGARSMLVAVVLGSLPFAAWLPTLLFQVQHTGAPWARPPGTGLVAATLAGFMGGGTSAGNLLEVAFMGLLGAAFYADLRAPDHTRIARHLLAIGIGTLLLGVGLTSVTSQGYAPRHAAVALAPLLLAAALALARLHPARTAAIATAVVTALGLLASLPAVVTPRTQADDVAAAIAAVRQPGDVVVTCPDQLAPAIERLVEVPTVRFPPSPSEPPGRVDWTDYRAHLAAASPADFAAQVDRLAGSHAVLLAWSPNYVRVGSKCRSVHSALLRLRPGARSLVALRSHVFENAGLEVFPGR